MPTLITLAEIDGLPSDPRQRFVALEEICRRRTEEAVKAAPEDNYGWSQVQEARRGYMTTVVAAARHFDIEPIKQMEIPKKADWNDGEFEDFQNEIDFYVMQMALEGADRNVRLSIVLQGTTKERLLTLVAQMREQVRKLDASPARIDSLLQKLNQFERDLDGPRLNFVAVAVLCLSVSGAISDAGGATTTIRQLLNKIEEAVGMAKEEQDKAAINQIPHYEMKKLESPRVEKPVSSYADFDLDDEIPF